jgi:hypothetical protein
MNIDEELKEVEAIHAAFDELVSHGTPWGLNHVTVSIEGLKELQRRIDRLHQSLREAVDGAHPNADTARMS